MNPEYHVTEAAVDRVVANDVPTPYVRARGLSKTFGHVRALRNVDVDIHECEVLAVVGDNGAGKSTLTKILSGVLQPDRGEIFVRERKVRMANPRAAHQFGIATVFQNLALVNCRDVACNLFLGRGPTRWGIFVNRGKMLAQARAALAELDVDIPTLLAEASELSGGQRQCVAIARATSQNSRIIIMDEPTAALGVKESGKVLDLILRLKTRGRGIVIISHNMHHVFSVADRILVLRRGMLAGVRLIGHTSPDEVVSMIVGSEISRANRSSVASREGTVAEPGSGE